MISYFDCSDEECEGLVTATRLDWLDVTLSFNRTYNDVSSYFSYYRELVLSARDKKIAFQCIFSALNQFTPSFKRSQHLTKV